MVMHWAEHSAGRGADRHLAGGHGGKGGARYAWWSGGEGDNQGDNPSLTL